MHLSPADRIKDDRSPYIAFCKNLHLLRVAAELGGRSRDLDRYLWLTGMYLKWLKERRRESGPQVNVELRDLFSNPDGGAAAELDAMLPAIIERTFRRNL